VRTDGQPFTVGTPDFWVAALELESGVVFRLTASFWVGGGKQRGDLEVYGDRGSLWLESSTNFDSALELSIDGNENVPQPLLREPYRGVDWARGLVDLAESIEHGRPHRLSAEHAAHVVEVLNAVDRSRRQGGAVEVVSSFDRPAPVEWAAA
jgi:predicted dehydrogenase